MINAGSSSISRRLEYVILVLCVGLSVFLLALPEENRIVVADRLGKVLTSPYWKARNFGEDVMRNQEENAWLKERVAELELMASTQQRIISDANRLAGPALDPGYVGELVPCRVVMRKRGRFATMIKIHSLVPVRWRSWQPVISGSGYLGRVRTIINDREAWIELLTSKDFAIGVEIERTGLLGVLRPRGDRFVVEMVGRDEDVRPGDLIITSGVAEIRELGTELGNEGGTPRGFPVGTVATVSSPSDKIFKEIVINPAASVDYNETVFVVTPFGPVLPGKGGH